MGTVAGWWAGFRGWWGRRRWAAKGGLIAAAIVALLVPLSALGSSGHSAPGKKVAVPSPVSTQAPPGTTQTTTATPARLAVSSVTDGDTLRLNDGRVVQLAQISAPSTASGDCFAKHSRTILSQLVAGATIKLAREPKLPRTDSYGHTVAYVMAKGKNVNLALVSKGAAAPYFYFGREGRFARPMVAAAAAARHRHTGLWGACSKTRLDPDHQLHTAGGRYTPPKKAPACTAGYSPCLINHGGADYDCAGGSGNGPYYTRSGVTYVVTGSDPYGLDSDGNGKGCESGGGGGSGGSGSGGGSGGGGGTGGSCTPGYSPCLVYHGGADYDCSGGSGNGPYYTAPGVVYNVTGSDPYGLDSDGNGLGCE
jgi:endonuclease YncB( thermonuclease family)